MKKCDSCSKVLTAVDRGEEVSGKLLCGMCLIKDKRNAFVTSSGNSITYRNATERIEDQIKKDKHPGYLGSGMVEVLAKTIPYGEDIISIVKGLLSDSYEGIMVLTNRRIIYVWRGVLYGTKVEDFSLERITSVQYDSGLIYADIKVMTGGNNAELKRVNKAHAKLFCERARSMINQPIRTTPVSQPVQQKTQSVPQIDVAEQLTKLARLKEQGYLTQEEFDSQKRKLLQL